MQPYSDSKPAAPVNDACCSSAVFARKGFFSKIVLAVLLHIGNGSAAAQYVTPSDEYRKRVDQASAISLSDNPFGAETNLYSGATEFTAVDIDLPGNNGLPVRFGRRFIVEDRKLTGYISGLDDWDVEVPHIETVASELGWIVIGYDHPDRYNRCTTVGAPLTGSSLIPVEQTWYGYRLHVPGQGDQELMRAIPGAFSAPATGIEYPWVTAGNIRLACLPTLQNGYPGQGFQALTPDGTRYRFDWMVERQAPTVRKSGQQMTVTAPRKRYFLLATRVEDRFGNWVAYSYSGDKLTGISASDGRSINVAYASGKVSTASAYGRVWTYQYNAAGLTAVVNPDGSRWTFAKTGSLISSKAGDPTSLPADTWEPLCLEADAALLGPFRMVITHPSGAQGDFQFGLVRHYRSSVPWTCHWEYPPYDHVSVPGGTNGLSPAMRDVLFLVNAGMPFRDALNAVPGAALEYEQLTGITVEHYPGQDELTTPNYFDVLALGSRTVTGPGVGPQITTYHYGEVSALGFCQIGSECIGQDEAKWVAVTRPDGSKDKYRYGVQYSINEGQLLETIRARSDDTTASRTQHTYVPEQAIGQHPFASKIGEPFRDIDMVAKVRPISRTVSTQDGVDYISSVNSFDAFARPVSLTRSSSISYGYSRSEVTTYHDNLSKWVLGQITSVSTGGAIPASATYDPITALPTDLYAFGVRKQTLTYNADGTVATIKDANNHVTTLSNWKRGIPQIVQYPATPESPSGSTETAQVNDHGWIDWVADENGYKTSYGYDAMGRVSSIAYPTDDSVNWNTVTRSFTQVNQPEMGVPAGHWRQSTVQGNYEKQVFFDALWRPIVQYERDIGNSEQTYRITLNNFDHEGRQTFASYPRNPYADGNWAIDTGVRTTYDALGRVTKVEQDSELGARLITTTEYLNGGETRVTGPNSQQTRTRYAAWDQPTTDYPIEIFHPESVLTQISRDYFFKPTQIRRSGTYAGQFVEATRKYYYDGAHRLCRTDEPETGSTVMGYDNADNMNWSAAGLSGLNTVDCDHVTAYNAGRTITRSYDARNRLSQIAFPGEGLGNQSWTYTKDGLPASVTTYNGAGNTLPVVNAYHYNKRRLLDGQGETVSQTGWYTWGLGYGYDANGHLAAQAYPTGLSITYAPNALGQPTQAGSYATGVKYYPNGAISHFTYGNGVQHAMSQNARQLPHTVSDVGVAGYTYTYDKNGNTTQIVDNGQGANFNRYLQYDGLNRLTAAGSAMFGGSTHYINYAYDPIDNIRSVSHPGVREHTYWYNGKNQLTNVQNAVGATVTGLDYDVQGNLNNKNGQQYGFDYGNRLRWVMGKENYRYGALGRRVETMQDDGTLRLFQYSQAGQYMFGWKKTPAGAETTQENVYLGGSLVATIDHNWPSNTVIATKYQHTDALGSPVAVTNTSGAVIERTNYEPYGSPINKTVDGIGYTGHVMDGSTGLTYMQQRYYDPTLGRFLSVDPVTADSDTGGNFNRYWYANNNPYKFTDPDGRLPPEIGNGQSTGIPFLDWLLTPSDARSSQRQMMKEQFASEMSQQYSWTDRVRFVATALSLGAGGAAGGLRGGAPLVRSAQPAPRMMTVGRWMSRAEYSEMSATGRVVEGAGGKTSVATGGPTSFLGAAKGSVYVEFQVAINSLVQGGKPNWFSILGPGASKSQKFMLEKQGGEILPKIEKLTPILKEK